MNELRQLQEALQNFLRHDQKEIEQFVVGKNKSEIKKRLEVYQEAYQLRLAENLQKQFPVIYKFLGAEFFSDLAKGYEKTYPPKHYAIRNYGAHFSDYLKSLEKPELAEVACLEWAMAIALDDSPTNETLTLLDFQKLSPENLLEMTFHFHPSLKKLHCDYQTINFWHTLQKNKFKKLAEKLPQKETVAVWSYQNQVYFRSVDDLENNLWIHAQEGKNFSDLSALAAESLPEEEAAHYTAQTILRWLKDGWLVKK